MTRTTAESLERTGNWMINVRKTQPGARNDHSASFEHVGPISGSKKLRTESRREIFLRWRFSVLSRV